MPRKRLFDYLQSHLFWAFDASMQGVPVFNPIFGFSKISAPQITAELESFKDGTYVYNRHVVKGGTVSPVTFERAASSFDSDFYDWIMFTLHGNKEYDSSSPAGRVANYLTSGGRASPRRNLLIVQFSSINVGKISVDNAALQAIIAGSAAVIAGATLGGGGLAAAAAAGAAYGLGPLQFATRLPARAWLLNGCLPVRYKAGTDFDANNASVSLQELEVQPESIQEFSLGIKP